MKKYNKAALNRNELNGEKKNWRSSRLLIMIVSSSSSLISVVVVVASSVLCTSVFSMKIKMFAYFFSPIFTFKTYVEKSDAGVQHWILCLALFTVRSTESFVSIQPC